MGLDAVEIVLRTEELFAITLSDAQTAAIRTARLGQTSTRYTTRVRPAICSARESA
jgi:hypothetical protein